jgi:hypothetical protein
MEKEKIGNNELKALGINDVDALCIKERRQV